MSEFSPISRAGLCDSGTQSLYLSLLLTPGLSCYLSNKIGEELWIRMISITFRAPSRFYTIFPDHTVIQFCLVFFLSQQIMLMADQLLHLFLSPDVTYPQV